MSTSNDHSKKLSSEKREQIYQLYSQRNKSVPVIPRYSGIGPVPLSFAQQRMWFEYTLNPTSSEYHLPTMLHITGPLKIPILKNALQEIVIRHEVLRTRFREEEDNLWQVVIPPMSPSCMSFSVLDLQALPEYARLSEAQRLQHAEMLVPFNLTEGPFVRIKILYIGMQEYIVMIIMHHCVTDAWSTGIFFQELSTLYNAFSGDHSTSLEPLALQYADFAAWQHSKIQGAVLDEGLAYWKQYLAGSPTYLNIPTDYPRPQQQNLHYQSRRFPLPRILVEQLKALARQENASFFMITLAAFQVLLFRYSGQNDFLIGFPIANRQFRETQKLIGYFLNTLVVRARFTDTLSFRDFFHQVRDDVFNAYKYQDIPLNKIMDILQVRRETSYHPLFQAMFVLQDISGENLSMDGLTAQFMDTQQLHSRFDITLNLQENEDGLIGIIQYNTSLFKDETAERMISHFHSLLTSIVSNQEKAPLHYLKFLTHHEQDQMLSTWNNTLVPYRDKQCLHHLFELQVIRIPDRVAFVFEDEHITYRELNRRANQLARYLQDLKIGSDIPVGICIRRSVTMIISVLAILKAGGAYVPIDPTYPEERIDFLLKDSQAPLLLTQKQDAPALFKSQIAVIYFDTINEALAELPDENQDTTSTPDNLAYIIYTSGSTGVPKGISMPHRPLTNLLAWHQSNIPDAVRTLQFASLSFDASIHEIFSAWSSGGTLCMIAEDLRQDPIHVASYLNKYMIDKCILPVVILQQIAEEDQRHNLDFPFLKTVITTGEQLRISKSVQELFRHLPHCTLHNHYGPSESHVVTAFTMPDALSTDWPTYPPIGRPIANTRLYVLDKHLQPVPIGIFGELYLGGICLARGYLHRSDFTSERFIANPFSNEIGDRLYKTGDTVRYLSDGNIEYIGRIDHQVKLRGMRIELGEIESVLIKHPYVQNIITLVREDEPGEKQLVAYIVPTHTYNDLSSELRSYLKTKLPNYMLPSSFVILDSFPLTHNGKVDRQALPRPERSALRFRVPYVAPTTEVERMIATIWQKVLQIEQPGLYDDFFEMGGHSLVATRLLSHLRSLFKVDIPLAALFENPTISALAQQIDNALHHQLFGEVSQINKNTHHKPIPLSFAQQRMWFFEQLTSTRLQSHIPLIFRLSGPLDSGALERSIAAIVTRHEILRTIFPLIDDQPQQIIRAPESIINHLFSVCDMSMLTQEQQAKETKRILHEATNTPFQLTQGPLFRIILLQERAGQYLFVMVFHHIIFDGVSEDILLHELSYLYDGFSSHQSPALPSLPIQYADFALWQRDQRLEEGLAYWKRQFTSASYSSHLPTDYPRPSIQSFDGATQSFLIPADLAQQLHTLSHQEHVTLFMTLLAAFRVLLYCYSGQEELLIGTPVAGRTQMETESLIGCFINTVVLHIDLSASPSFLSLLTRVRETALNAYAYQDIPFEQIVDILHIKRDARLNALYQIMFLLHPMNKNSFRLQGLTITPINLEHAKTKFDLTIALNEMTEGIAGVFEYNTALFKRETISNLSKYFILLLETIVLQPERSIANLRQTFKHKIEYKLPPLPDEHPIMPQIKFVAPQNKIEKEIANIWQSLLHREKIGLYDNFFDVGGHSLLLIQVHSRLKETICPTVTMLDLFVHPTISSLVKCIHQQMQDFPAFEKSDVQEERHLQKMKKFHKMKRRKTHDIN